MAANYDPFRKRISFLRGFRSRSIMVHELTHALQDQHFNLSRKVLDGPLTFDRLLALGALAPINTWDFPAYAGFCGLIVIYTQIRARGDWDRGAG